MEEEEPEFTSEERAQMRVLLRLLQRAGESAKKPVDEKPKRLVRTKPKKSAAEIVAIARHKKGIVNG